MKCKNIFGLYTIGFGYFFFIGILLAEGFGNSKSRKKFVMRLFVFSLISEISNDIAVSSSTLLIALSSRDLRNKCV